MAVDVDGQVNDPVEGRGCNQVALSICPVENVFSACPACANVETNCHRTIFSVDLIAFQSSGQHFWLAYEDFSVVTKATASGQSFSIMNDLLTQSCLAPALIGLGPDAFFVDGPAQTVTLNLSVTGGNGNLLHFVNSRCHLFHKYYNILYAMNADSFTVIDGIVFERGVANNADINYPVRGPQKSGSALYLDGENGWSYADVVHCTFRDNYADSFGGAVYVNGRGTGSVAPRFLNCVFERNHARLDGAALYRNGGSWAERIPDFDRCRFESNRADRRGSALMIVNSELTDTIEITRSDFYSNENQFIGGPITGLMGRANGGYIKINFCKIVKNRGATASMISLVDFNFFDLKAAIIINVQFEKISIRTASHQVIKELFFFLIRKPPIRYFFAIILKLQKMIVFFQFKLLLCIKRKLKIVFYLLPIS